MEDRARGTAPKGTPAFRLEFYRLPMYAPRVATGVLAPIALRLDQECDPHGDCPARAGFPDRQRDADWKESHPRHSGSRAKPLPRSGRLIIPETPAGAAHLLPPHDGLIISEKTNILEETVERPDDLDHLPCAGKAGGMGAAGLTRTGRSSALHRPFRPQDVS